MTQGQKALRLKLLGAVHKHPFCKESKAQEVWGEYLQGLYGVESSGRLSIDELYNLLDILHKKTDKAIQKGLRATPKGKATGAQIHAIETLWEEKARDGSSEAMMRFAKRVTGVLALSLTALTQREATHVIVALKRMV